MGAWRPLKAAAGGGAGAGCPISWQEWAGELRGSGAASGAGAAMGEGQLWEWMLQRLKGEGQDPP